MGSWPKPLTTVTESFNVASSANHLLLRLFVASKVLNESLVSCPLLDTSITTSWQSSQQDEKPRLIRAKASTLLQVVLEASHQLMEITHLDQALSVSIQTAYFYASDLTNL